ncbi:LysR family transcriptional regulator [Rhodococcus hoagii]|nr:LysR family transcriptional regulator [Prescottella equi]NKS56501.1 LysR family transcriptional regulator [Prescottella equi]NKS64845.1 LysR family transcriptional regulator [Prescottella equi]NKS70089.1 LysR family transcriptional regulator [Prescottella equi]NKZ93442.1 LysR family transcriptional regulator [Prescottella equi]
MDVQRLRILRELSDRGTVSAVASALSMTPSAVSQQLKTLGREAGVQLVEPDGRRLRLTPAGHALVLRADEVLAALDQADLEMASYRGSPRGRIRVAMFPSCAALLLPGALRRLNDSEVLVEATDINEPLDAVPSLLADYEIVISHCDAKAAPPTHPRVQYESLMREPIDLALSAKHHLASRPILRIEDVADEPWISVRKGFVPDDVLQCIAAGTGVRPRIVQRINDDRATTALVAGGYGVALLPRYAVCHSTLVRREFEGLSPARMYILATRPASRRSRGVNAVLQAFRDEALIAKDFG